MHEHSECSNLDSIHVFKFHENLEGFKENVKAIANIEYP